MSKKTSASEPEGDGVPESEGDAVPEPEYIVAGGKVVNAPTAPNNGGFENRVSPPARVADKTAGANSSMPAHAFEQRAVQEQGTH